MSGTTVTTTLDFARAVLLILGASVVIGAWIRFVLLGNGERELRRIERIWGPARKPEERDDSGRQDRTAPK